MRAIDSAAATARAALSGMTWPAALTLHFWSLKRATILVGFILSMLGSVGAHVYVEPAEKIASGLDDAIKTSSVTAELLKNAYAQYFMFQQQGSLIFAISTQASDDASRDIIGKLHQMSLLDRADPVRQIIGQLAIAGLLNYRQTYDAYAELIAKSRKDFTLQNFMAVNTFEKDMIQRSQTQAGQLQVQRYTLVQRKAAADRDVDNRKFALLLLGFLGSTFLLAANLISTREEPKPEKHDG